MKFEAEVKTVKFQNEVQKAHLNLILSASWVRARIAVRLKPYDLTNEQFNLLRIVRGAMPDCIRIKDINSRMLDHSSNTTRIIDKLEAKQFVERKADIYDRRSLLVCLTEKGKTLLQEIDLDWANDTPHRSALLNDEECLLLGNLLDKLREG